MKGFLRMVGVVGVGVLSAVIMDKILPVGGNDEDFEDESLVENSSPEISA